MLTIYLTAMKNIPLSGFACFSQKLEVAPFTEKDFRNILILESDPQQGYFFGGKLPEKTLSGDHHLYLPIKQSIPCFQDKVIRYAHVIMLEQKHLLHVSPGQMTFENKPHACIRVRMNELGELNTFIDDMEALGIEFYCKRRFKTVKPYISLVQFKKFIALEKLQEKVYRSLYDQHVHFVEISKDIDYSFFENLIEDIKNNCELNMFNTSLVYFHTLDKTIDFVAIYSHECNEERLPLLAEFLEKEMQRYRK